MSYRIDFIDFIGNIINKTFLPCIDIPIHEILYKQSPRERSGSVVECLTRDRRAAGSGLTGVTELRSLIRYINPSLLLVQPRKTRSYITERMLMGR